MKPEPQMTSSGRYTGLEGVAIADDPRSITLVQTLALAVPLWIWELRERTDKQRAAIAHRCSAIVAEKGDILMFRSRKNGATAAVFNALAEGIAAAAFQPGGITFAGRHWCIDHQQCEDAAAYAANAAAAIATTQPADIPRRPIADVPLADSAREAL